MITFGVIYLVFAMLSMAVLTSARVTVVSPSWLLTAYLGGFYGLLVLVLRIYIISLGEEVKIDGMDHVSYSRVCCINSCDIGNVHCTMLNCMADKIHAKTYWKNLHNSVPYCANCIGMFSFHSYWLCHSYPI